MSSPSRRRPSDRRPADKRSSGPPGDRPSASPSLPALAEQTGSRLSYARRRRLRDLAFLAVGALVAGGAAFLLVPHEAPAPIPAAHDAAPPAPPDKPWGRVVTTPLTLQPPLARVDPAFCSTTPPVWHFHGTTHDELASTFAQASVAHDLAAAWLARAACGTRDTGCSIAPSRDEILALSESSRASLYAVLASFEDNPQHDPFTRRHARLDGWAQASEIKPETYALVKRLVYTDGDVDEFADEAAVCTALDEGERSRFARAIVRTPSVLAKLEVGPWSDRDALSRYWGRAGRRDAVTPLLEAAAHEQGGASLSLVTLLPPIPRLRVFTYARPGEPPYNCWWTALNFFEDVPNDGFMSPELAQATIAKDYQEVPLDSLAFGDLVVLRDAHDVALHVAVHLAGDVVFTKNGRSPGRPWTLDRLEDLGVVYPRTQRMQGFRRRGSAE